MYAFLLPGLWIFFLICGLLNLVVQEKLINLAKKIMTVKISHPAGIFLFVLLFFCVRFQSHHVTLVTNGVMCTSLKVTPHPRGHIASCNGRVETIEAWVEPVDILSCPTCASHRAAQVQRLAQQEREKKLAKLVKFRKDVKRRVHQVQKTREQKTCAETTANSPRGKALSHTVCL